MNLGFLGAGKMAEAMMRGLLRAGLCTPSEILASDASPERRAALAPRLPIRIVADNAAVLRGASILVLAVKPQQLETLLAEIAPLVGPQHLVFSIAAGKPLAFLEARLPEARLIRVMPNLACVVGEAMSAFALGRRATADDRAFAGRFLACFGKARELPEDRFDAVTALSGSGPAFFAYLLDRLADGAVAEGLDGESARQLAAQTMLGTARLLLENGQAPRDLMDAVTSARGTTAEGRAVLEASDVGEVLVQTIRAAARRSRELSQA